MRQKPLHRLLLIAGICLLFSFVSQAQVNKDTLSIKLAPKPVQLLFDANVICPNDSIFLKVDHSASGIISHPIYRWNNLPSLNLPSQYIYLSKDTTRIWVDLYDGMTFIGSDTVNLYLTSLPLPYTVINDTICLGNEATVGITTGKYWDWSTFGTTQYINDRPLRTTQYRVHFSNYPMIALGFSNRCFSTDSATAVVLTEASYILTGDSAVCKGLDAKIYLKGGHDIIWSDSSRQDFIFLYGLQNSTILKVTATDLFGCRGVKTWPIRVFEHPDGEIINLSDSLICLGKEVQLHVRSTCDSLRWFTGSEDSVIRFIPKQSLMVYCDIINTKGGGCSARLYKALEVQDCLRLYFPSGFKIDGLTKTYGPIGEIESQRNYYFAIFTRNGKMIFETKNLALGWDGRYKGEWVKPDVYVYYFKASWDRFTTERNGTITVVK